MLGQRERRQPQAGNPPLRSLVKQRQRLIGELDPAGLEQLPSLPGREAQILVPDLEQLAGEAKPVQPDLRLLAGRKHQAQLSRHMSDEQPQPGECVWRVKLVEIVDHQRQGLLE